MDFANQAERQNLEQSVQDYISSIPAKKQPLDYVNSSNAKIFFNGIVVDECYDIQYSYKEFKEPIYGYNSKYYDAVVNGNVIIHGSFTINYKHDKYLYAILSKGHGSSVDNAKTNIKNYKDFNKDYKQALMEYKQIKQQIKDAERDAIAEKQFLKQTEQMKKDADTAARLSIGTKQGELDTKSNERANFYAGMSDADQARVLNSVDEFKGLSSAYDSMKSDILGNINELNANISSFRAKIASLEAEKSSLDARIDKAGDYLSQNFYSQWDYDQDVSQAKDRINEINMQIDAANAQLDILDGQLSQKQDAYSEFQDYVNENLDTYGSNTKDAVKLDYEYDLKQAEVADTEFNAEVDRESAGIDLADQTDQVKKADQKVANLKGLLADQLKQINMLKDNVDSLNVNWDKIASETANSLDKRAEDMGEFVLFINYNGSTHKIIKGCHLVGHSHPIQMAGENVKEYYSFIARSIE